MKKNIFIITVFIVLIHHILHSQIKRDSAIKLLNFVKENVSNFNKSYPLIKKALDFSLKTKDTSLIIQSYIVMADVLWYNSIYGNSEEYYFKAMEITDSSKFSREYAYALYGIGWIECIQKGKKEKIQLLKRALKIYELLKDTSHIVQLSNAISGAYQGFYFQDTANKYYLDSAIKVLKNTISNLSENWYNRAVSLAVNLAKEYYLKQDYNNAYISIIKSLSNPKLIKFKRSFLNAILIKAQILNKINQKDSSRYLIKKYFNDLITTQDNEVLEELYYLLYEHNKEDGNYQKAMLYLEKHLQIIKIINKELLSTQYEELEANKELYKKEQSLIALQKENEINQLKNQQKTYFLFVAAIFILIITFFLFKTIRQNAEIKKLNSEITAQKNLLEQKNKDITDSINYAFRIQKALITSDEFIQKHFINENYFSDFFVLYLPKDIVSGDFYWANVNTQHPQHPHYFAVSDCTGHGVPGAFMSLLNINFLNEAVIEKQIYYPDEILNYVREKLVKNLSYDEQQKDGMDATLLLFDNNFKQHLKIYYTLANHQLLLVRNNELITLTGDKKPVGFSYSNEPFSLKEIVLQKGDWLYLFTDGYKDQFGGPKGKRLMQKNFMEIIKSHSTKKGDEQMQALKEHYYQWKNHQEQIDDVCIVGIKVG